MRIKPAKRVRGQLRLPGDKSISHRAAIIAALAHGRSTLQNYSTSEDCARTLACLRALGVKVEQAGSVVQVEGVGLDGFVAPRAELDCGNSGTTMRLLAGVLAGQEFASTLSGDDSLRARPMRRVIEPLELMGAQVSSEGGRAPLHIEGRRPLRPITYAMPVPSAQVKSCIMLAGLKAAGRTSVIESGGRTRDHTERMLKWFGVPLETRREQNSGADATAEVLTIEGPASFAARDLEIPGDISSATFFIAAAALLPGSVLELKDIGLNRTRSQVLSTLRELRVDVKVSEERERCNEQVGTIHVCGKAAGLAPVEGTRANILRGSLIPQLIDELPMLAVLGTQVPGGLTIRDAAELRLKESDRIAAVVKNLRAMGAQVEEYEDGLTVGGPTRLRGAKLDAFGDHRIAMAFTIAALIAEGETQIAGAEACVGVSFPEFYAMLESVVER
ncbi:MAG TPA: 3-phosphoshikimate 1-carboxyvinyltransferase [Pyrinomonadaceae bacterium]|jgi:3-phosphoshikimate 1-carboxyvinyltransferase|nr:3-phosphoshikimate 1-carboxyvinyltransferase [Pyrinomonadaceae bacterium]